MVQLYLCLWLVMDASDSVQSRTFGQQMTENLDVARLISFRWLGTPLQNVREAFSLHCHPPVLLLPLDGPSTFSLRELQVDSK
jgi:hypothetical protein